MEPKLIEILIVFMIISAVIAIELKELLSSVIAVGGVGLGLVVTFLLLQAPDLAIIQLVVEIVVLIILVRATIARDMMDRERKEIFVLLSYMFFAVVFIAASLPVLERLPQFGNPIMGISKAHIDSQVHDLGTGRTVNLVNRIAMNYRFLDVLGAVAIMVSAVIGSLAILRVTGRIRK